jgi:6-pyruvoyltetrahydropterin/6-carboxytetrahydropterin synthase
MNFEVGVVAHFRAHHHLMGDFGPASQPHEHAYRVEVGVSGSSLRADGTLFDITRLQNALRAALGDLEGNDLNTISVLAEPNPSAEVVARYLFERIAPSLSEDGLDRLQTRVWESPEAYASYSGDLV